jgi:hypothetical protein
MFRLSLSIFHSFSLNKNFGVLEQKQQKRSFAYKKMGKKKGGRK